MLRSFHLPSTLTLTTQKILFYLPKEPALFSSSPSSCRRFVFFTRKDLGMVISAKISSKSRRWKNERFGPWQVQSRWNLEWLMKFQLDNSRAKFSTRAVELSAVKHARPLEVRSKFIAHSLWLAFTRSCDTDYNQLPRYHGVRWLRLCPLSTRTIAQ